MLQMRPPMFHCCATIPAVLLAASATQLSAQAGQPPPAGWLRDSLAAARVACQVAQATRSPSTKTMCYVEAFRDTGSEFVLQLRERPTNPPDTLTFPRSEVRLWKDRTEAVLTRIPEQ
jgi:hypothetical protein